MKVKKIIVSMLCVIMIASLAACGDSSKEDAKKEETVQSTEAATEEAADKSQSAIEETTDAADKPQSATEADSESKTESEAEPEKEKSGVLAYDGDELVSKYTSFELKSENLKDGVWDDAISYTDRGSNQSPQLSWEPVEGASCYAIYMVDINMHYFIHWVSSDVTETELPLGWAKETEYVGPYPPDGGTHTYDVYVIALKNPVERLKGGLNSITQKMQDFIDSTDTDADGNTGNIIAIGHLSGDFTH